MTTATLGNIGHQIAVCDRKKVYDKLGAALIKASRMKDRGKHLTPYACPICGKWHLTSKGGQHETV